ncbi:protamine-like [Calliphora vicina]|uniref:protamine-like n=1 Tax=Calliphora vicina TaxID=7373 RepID=UPI00325C074F
MAQCPPVRRTTRMATRVRHAKCPTSCPTPTTQAPSSAPARCMRPGPVQRNPFLNFLREYRKTCCGLTAIETVRQGAKAWKALSKEEKQRFIVEAFYAPKRRRHSSAMCGPAGRPTGPRVGRITKRNRSAISRRNRAYKTAARRKTKVC